MLRLLLGRAKTVKGQEVVPLIRRGTFLVLLLIWSVAATAAALSVWLLYTRAASQTEATAQGLEQYARRNIEISSFVADDFVRFLDLSLQREHSSQSMSHGHHDANAGPERATPRAGD